MSSKFSQMFLSFFQMEKHERYKLLMLSISIFFIIGAYTLVRELKSSIFMAVCGKEYIPWARMLVMICLVPAVLFYSLLVDKLRRYQLIYFYSLFYGILGIIFTILVAHPVIGLANTEASPYRLFGWFFYFFIEGFSPFVVSVFWAFANSVYSPEEAKENYAFIVSSSKIGGMITAGLAWILFSLPSSGTRYFSDVAGHQVLLLMFSVLVLLIPFVIHRLIVKVPGRYLHGYEAAYQLEKKKKKEGADKPGMLSGLMLLIQNPYILGIFGMLFFYEVVSTVLSYHRLGVAQASAPDICGVSCFLFQAAFIQHFVGLAISFLGTRTLLHRFGERVCLLLIPGITLLLLLYFTLSYTWLSVVSGIILLQSINYAFAQPVRESLYIPTVKDIKFKSKSWIDAFGSRFAKGVGSMFNVFADLFGESMFFGIHSAFFGVIIAFWTLTAYLLGNRYVKAIENNEVIGKRDAAEEEVDAAH